MYLIRIALFVLFTQVVNVSAQSSGDFTTPLNEWGHPDLNGVWNFASNTPMQRPEKWGDQEFLTPEQIREERERQQAAAKAADERAARAVDLDAELPTGPQVLGYNDFWFETEGLETNMRTSHIVYPLDGRIPDAVEGAKVQRGNQITDTPNEIRPVRFVVGGISKDGPEDRGLSESFRARLAPFGGPAAGTTTPAPSAGARRRLLADSLASCLAECSAKYN